MGWFKEDPLELFKEHVWINPFGKMTPRSCRSNGPGRVVFGSDWPHIEGMPAPLDYVMELKEIIDDQNRYY